MVDMEQQEAAAQGYRKYCSMEHEGRELAGLHAREQDALRQRMGKAQAEHLRRQQAELQQLMKRYQVGGRTAQHLRRHPRWEK